VVLRGHPIIDDEPVIRETLCSILKDEGYDVSTADTGKKALDLAGKSCFDTRTCQLPKLQNSPKAGLLAATRR